jgi:hypothetical protein
MYNTGCDHSRFLVVPDWYANGCCRVLALEQTQYSMLNVYLVFKNKVHKVLFEKGVLLFEKGVLLFEKGVLLSEKGGLLFEKGVLLFEKGVLLFEKLGSFAI